MTRPYARTLIIKENLSVVGNDRQHNNVVQDGSDESSCALNGEGPARRHYQSSLSCSTRKWGRKALTLGVLAQLQISQETGGLLESIGGVQLKVHVRLGRARDERSAEHLEKVGKGGRETSDGVECSIKGHEERPKENGHDQGPDRKMAVASNRRY